LQLAAAAAAIIIIIIIIIINGEVSEPSTKQCSLRCWRALKGNVLLQCFSGFVMKCGQILTARVID
jgi:hypothetical protein